MGTVWNIEVVDQGRPDQARAAVEKAYAELERIDALMSEWKPESPISQVNAAAGKHPVEVPAELREILERSIRYSAPPKEPSTSRGAAWATSGISTTPFSRRRKRW